MEYYDLIYIKRQKAKAGILKGIIIPLILAAIMCIVDVKVTPNYTFHIGDLFFNAARVAVFYAGMKYLVKGFMKWGLKGIFPVVAVLSAILAIAELFGDKHTWLYDIPVQGFCENLEFAMIAVFFSMTLSLINLIKFAYYSHILKVDTIQPS
ncbi:MAG: hypothetical protein IJO54_00720 [Oscillospiraceae bacterium]|nr:hypothetical protein [Oscillospiraceae bacterium]